MVCVDFFFDMLEFNVGVIGVLVINVVFFVFICVGEVFLVCMGVSICKVVIFDELVM